MKILFIGDVVGPVGRRLVRAHAAALRQEYGASLVIANVENVAGGAGVTPETVAEVVEAGVDVATSGNHVFAHRDAVERMDDMPKLIRPLNYPPGTPGRGWLVAPTPRGVKVAVINAAGRVFMEALDCPFRGLDEAVEVLRGEAPLIVVDFHAEATSEKEAMAHYLDGRVAALLGTHTHVQTADERVLPGGTAYITDVGMTGPTGGIIGTEARPVLDRFVTRMPARFKPARGSGVLSAVVVDADEATGRATAVERLVRYEE
ncbi:MAG: TIGR00282 family metallophosphoesterase [Candidatus Coatesbacteria bacterium]|nr:MAG: TIGR00282 family metallophosphoesterase [Candidatus Coatesbacteria bacterium]